MDVAITQTAEVLIERLQVLGYKNPELIIEQALQCFFNQQHIDTAIGFPELTEAEIIEENEQCWQAFQKDPQGISHAQVEALFTNKSNPS